MHPLPRNRNAGGGVDAPVDALGRAVQGGVPAARRLRSFRHRAGRRASGTARGVGRITTRHRSEEHTSDLQSLMRNAYAVVCLTKNKHTQESNIVPARYTTNTNT